MNGSTPSLTEFDPDIIPYQGRVIRDIRKNFDYRLGTHEILLSGSVGSAKSILMAHVAVTHCLFNAGARFLLGRESMPALRSTLYNKVMEHIEPDLKEGYDYYTNQTRASINFRNGSEIICRSWADKKYMKMRSLELSGAAIEEGSENRTPDANNEIKMRVGRLPHIKEKIMITATNPDEPDHWLYKYFMQSNAKTRHVYYSVTTENPFLPPEYIEQLKTDLDPRMAQRMIYGQWISIAGENLYYEYDRDHNYIDKEYEVNPAYPIILTWDFNIGDNKPMSLACMQFIDDKFHVFKEVVVKGGRTADTLDELGPYLDKKYRYHVCGDAAGKHRDTRSSKSDYDIIMKYLRDLDLQVEYHVPLANPPIRTRHNLVNAYCHNTKGQRRLFIYKSCPTADEGMRLTKLKTGANYIEDDSKPYQHITTAIGYAMIYETKHIQRKPQGSIQL